VLTPSTPLAYPQVVSCSFALFRVVNFSVLAGKATFCSGFDRSLALPQAYMRPTDLHTVFSCRGSRRLAPADHQAARVA
jgi:hypothetical protein